MGERELPPQDVPVVDPGPPEYRCYRCGNPHDPFQEYCLECGARLVPLPGGSRSTVFQRESPFWFWAAFLGLLAIALVTAGVVLATRDDDKKAGPTSSTAPTTIPILPPATSVTTGTLPETIPPPTNSITVPTLPTTTSTFPTTTVPQTTTQGTTTQGTTTQGSGELTQWPANREEGWTVFLASVPHSEGRASAEAKARAAKQKGLPEVGVLDTDNYSSLRAGFYAVFSGIYETRAQALANRTRARTDYPSAYEKRVVQ